MIPSILYGLAKDHDICEGLSPVIKYITETNDKVQGAWQLNNISETLKKYNIPEAQEAFETCVAPYIKIVRPNFVPKSAARE
jgi:hypothetical protein